MSRVLVRILQVVFVLGAFVYVTTVLGLRYLPLEHGFQQVVRPRLATVGVFVDIFGLKGVGDRRVVYAHMNELSVVVAHPDDVRVNEQVEGYVVDMVEETVGATAMVEKVELSMPVQASYEDEEVDSLAEEVLGEYEPDLLILYLSSNAGRPTIVGEAIADDVIVMYEKTLRGLSERESIRARIEESTVLHEWGHLLGLEHVGRENCVMSAVVEVYGNRRYQDSNIPTDFCVESLLEIRKL